MTGFNAKTGELLLTKPNPSKEAVWEVCGYVQRRGSAAGRGSWAELNHPGAAGWDWLGKESITGMTREGKSMKMVVQKWIERMAEEDTARNRLGGAWGH